MNLSWQKRFSVAGWLTLNVPTATYRQISSYIAHSIPFHNHMRYSSIRTLSRRRCNKLTLFPPSANTLSRKFWARPPSKPGRQATSRPLLELLWTLQLNGGSGGPGRTAGGTGPGEVNWRQHWECCCIVFSEKLLYISVEKVWRILFHENFLLEESEITAMKCRIASVIEYWVWSLSFLQSWALAIIHNNFSSLIEKLLWISVNAQTGH